MNFIALQPIGSSNIQLINLNHVSNIILGTKKEDIAIVKFSDGQGDIQVKKSVIVKQIPFISLD
tara:strand:+ start:1783 stop:1974 length:192 start_codon:yes stop_codon:yes gene_type:complete